jgi:hypothetical protein
MTHLLTIFALMSAWLNKITPESSYITILSLRIDLSFVYQILSLFHSLLQHCCEGYSADTAQINAWRRSYAYNIALLTANIAVAS